MAPARLSGRVLGAWGLALGLALPAATVPRPAAAQSLGGRVVEEGTDAPVVGALVTAADSVGEVRGRTLTRGDGTFVLRLPAPGTYTVEVQRIGIRSRTTGSVVVPADAPAHLSLQVRPEALALEGISVRAERRCRLAEDAGGDVARVWDEVRKALETAVVAGEESLLTYEVERFERTLEAEGMRIVEGSSSRRTVRAEQPFRSVDAEELRRHGFIRPDGGGHVYFAPDAEVLLSPAFLDTHCLRLAEADHPERIAVAFEPVPGRTVPEIEGRIVVDRSSGVLEGLNFRYVRSPSPARDGLEGGTIRFVRAPNGVWVPADWRIRMTMKVERRTGFGDRESGEFVTTELSEFGGRVLSVRAPGGARWSMSEGATLSGRVVRAGGGGPLPGARVRVEGTAYSTTTDAEGRYRFAGLAAGRYAVRAWHPALDSVPWPEEPGATAELPEDGEARAEVIVPTESDLLRTACEGRTLGGDEALTPESRVVFGVVRNARGTSVPGARVVVGWDRWSLPGGVARGIVGHDALEAETRTNDAGRFVVCGLPEDTELAVSAEVGDAASGESPVESHVRIARVDLVVGGNGGDGADGVERRRSRLRP